LKKRLWESRSTPTLTLFVSFPVTHTSFYNNTISLRQDDTLKKCSTMLGNSKFES
jgi:hypothetical protein